MIPIKALYVKELGKKMFVIDSSTLNSTTTKGQVIDILQRKKENTLYNCSELIISNDPDIEKESLEEAEGRVVKDPVFTECVIIATGKDTSVCVFPDGRLSTIFNKNLVCSYEHIEETSI